MFDPIDRSYFIPNMSTVIDAENKQVISSPDMAKEGFNNGNQEIKINDNKQQINDEKQQLNNKEESDNNEKE